MSLCFIFSFIKLACVCVCVLEPQGLQRFACFSPLQVDVGIDPYVLFAGGQGRPPLHICNTYIARFTRAGVEPCPYDYMNCFIL